METLASLFILASTSFNLPPGLLDSLCYVESKYNVNAVHLDDGGDRDSLGICQVQLRSAYDVGFRGTAEELMEPKTNIIVAAAILKTQIKRYNSVRRGVIAYNIGNAKNLQSSEYQVRVYKRWGHK